MSTTVLFLLLIILIIVAVLLLISISNDYAPVLSDVIDADNTKTKEGGAPVEKRKVLVIDGLNYIYDKFLTTNKKPVNDVEDENIISNYPNIFYIWKALSTLRQEHKKDHIVFVIKNQDGYKLSVYEDKLYKRWAKSYKLTIIMCYDSSNLTGPHYVKGRDDKTVCEIFDKYKVVGAEVELISKDKYADRANFSSVPAFKKIKYGDLPYIAIND
jgi:hypothetical protein